MTNLTRLECAIKVRCIGEGRSLPSGCRYSKQMATIILCWILYFNKGLTHVKLDGIDLTTYKPVRILAQTLSGIAHLRSLELSTDMTVQDQTKDLLGEFLLFHCNHTLEVFHLKAEVGFSSRTIPMVVTPRYDHTLTAEYFQECAPPADWMSSSFSVAVTETVEVEIPRPLSLNKMLSIIKDQPLRLKRVTVDYPRKYDEFHETPGSVIDILDQHTLESLNISFFKEGPYTCLTSKLFRHSETLCDLTFEAVESLYSTTILNLLCNCCALEELVVRGAGNSKASNNKDNMDDIRYLQDISLAVTHAVAKPWVCLHLSHLEIPVMLDWFTYTALPERGGILSWFHHWRHTQGDSDWEALRKFYEQIGALHQLQVLDLKVCLVYPGSVPSGATWSDISLPGMLLMPFTPKPSSSSSSLPARNKNISAGFLDLLSGLKKLRELRGSVRVDLPVMMSAMRLDSYR
ncbi:hypothetical protein BGZ47_007753 [Haplosporangium gracile]|nr:hypothetical protein BGZ47_007753 [Haplosporangium gracile]